MRDEFFKVEGEVRYGDLGANQAREFRQAIAMNTEGALLHEEISAFTYR